MMDVVTQRMGRLWFLLRAQWIVWYYILNRNNRRIYRKEKRPLDMREQEVVNDLKKYGIATIHLDDLFPGERVFETCKAYTNECMRAAETKTNKKFLKQLWDAYPVIDFDNPFLQLTLRENILQIVDAYMQMAAKLYYLTLNITTPMDEGAEAVQSQKWHRDPEDRCMIKMFLYLNDVDETSGPFIYVRESHGGGRLASLFPQHPPRGSGYIEEGDWKKYIPPDAINVYTGKAGTLIFCDTVGLHKGGYATAGERIMFTAGYCSSASAWPSRYQPAEHFEEKQKQALLPPLARFALSYKPGRLNTYFLKKFKKNLKYD